MIDLDGTTIPNGRYNVPSKKVADSIEKAKKILQVSVVTARRYTHTKPILEVLGLSGPSIVSGGAEIRDSKDGDILWSKYISENTTKEILQVFKDKKYPIWVDDNNFYLKNTILDPRKPPKETLQISIVDVPLSESDRIVKVLSEFNEITIHKAVSWDSPDKVWLSITHNEASKQHGIFEVSKLLGIDSHEIIGVGDGYNDFPLLMACGLRVAMGNAVPELKEIADYIAPNVEDDGLADVIERFVL